MKKKLKLLPLLALSLMLVFLSPTASSVAPGTPIASGAPPIVLAGLTFGLELPAKIKVARLGGDKSFEAMAFQFLNGTDWQATILGGRTFTGTYMIDKKKVMFTLDGNGMNALHDDIQDWTEQMLNARGVFVTPTINILETDFTGKAKESNRGTSLKIKLKTKFEGSIPGEKPSKGKFQAKGKGSTV